MFSYWEKELFFKYQDVIIIGSGFVGLWTAIELAQKNSQLKITIVEKGVLPTGASTKNAGFSCFGSPTELIHDAKNYSEETMWQTVEKRYKGIKKIQQYFAASQIDYEETGGYECLQKEEETLVNEKLQWLNNGLQQITGAKQVFAFSKNGLEKNGLLNMHSLVCNNLEGGLNPAKLILALQQKAIGLGVTILNNISVANYETKENNIWVYAQSDIVFKTKKLIICTNAFAKNLIPALNITPCRGQVFVTNEVSDLKLKGCFHFDSGYYYFRNIGKRLLIGGARNTDMENENTTAIETTPKIQNALINFTQKHLLPNTPFVIDTAWSGIMGFSQNKQAIVQKIDENIYCAVGMNGIGVAIAPIVAEDVVGLMEGVSFK
jgi:gamma-glutamylputrescine oxidase